MLTTAGSGMVDGFIIEKGVANGTGSADKYGGGLMSLGGTLVVANCVFRSNNADYGGAIFMEGPTAMNASTFIINCAFYSNSAYGGEGGAVFTRGNAHFSNCLFWDNHDSALHIDASGLPADVGVANCTFYDNASESGKGRAIHLQNGVEGVANSINSVLTIHNSILWPRSDATYPGQISVVNYNGDTGGLVEVIIEYTDLYGTVDQTGSNIGVTTNHLISSDPLFIENAPGIVRIPPVPAPTSPCVDTGNNDLVSQDIADLDGDGNTTEPLPLDRNGHDRFIDESMAPNDGEPGTLGGPIVDMGAFESSRVIHVYSRAPELGTSLPGNNEGASWGTAFRYLQDALAEADRTAWDDEIWVAGGTYYPDEGTGYDTNDSEASFAIQNGVALYGGFAGWESRREQRNANLSQSILSGWIQRSLPFDWSYHVVTAINTDQTAILDGFVIEDGRRQLDNPPDPWNKGGGLYIDGGRPTIANCSFKSNDAEFGGAIYIFDGAEPKIINCSFIDNRAGTGAGIYADLKTAPVLINCSFLDNSATEGAGLYAADQSLPTVINSTYYGNNADQYGGALYCSVGAVCSVFNSIMWGNNAGKGPQIALEGATLIVDFSAIQGGENDIVVDDESVLDLRSYIAPLQNPFQNSSGRLAAGSPCIDAGDNTAVPIDSLDLDSDGNMAERVPVDLDGLIRFVDDPFTVDSGRGDPPNYPQIVDMGAYEHQRPPSAGLYVDSTADGANNGSSWTDAYVHLQDALLTAQDGDTIWVAAGTYKHTQGGMPPADPRAATFQLKNGVALYGGFPQGGSTWPPNPTTHKTILSGDINGDDDTDFNNYAENVRHVVTGSGTGATAILDGFTVTGGNASDVPYPAHSGGGMYNYFGNLTVRKCSFKYNLSQARGGGMFNHEGSPTLSNCVFAHNRAENGGAMYNAYNSSPAVTDGTFYFNQAFSYGGAAHDAYGSHPSFTNCTFSVNTAGISGGAIGSYNGGPTLVKTILWQNDASEGRQITLFGGSSVAVNCSDVEGGQDGILTTGSEIINWGSGNIDTNPRFCQPSNDVYTIAENSPCSSDVSSCGLIGAWPVGCDAICLHDINFDADVDGVDLAIYLTGSSFDDLADFARDFGGIDCQ